MSKQKPKTKEHILSGEDIRKVRRSIKTDKERLSFEGLVNTGLRISEFIHLRRSWVNFKTSFIKIPDKQICNCMECKNKRRKIEIKAKNMKYDILEEDDSYSYGSRRRRKKKKGLSEHQKLILKGYWLPKTSASVRTIPIVPEAKEVLQPYFKKHKTMLEIFPARQYVNNTLNGLRRRCNVKLFPHALRGTFATMLAVKKFDAFEITDTLGWSDINVAIFYIKLSGATLKSAFDEKWGRDIE